MRSGALILPWKSVQTNNFTPSQPMGEDISTTKQIILTFRRANVDEIVLVLGENFRELEQELQHLGVTFLKMPESLKEQEMFSFVKIGLEYFQGRCQQILVTPTVYPLFQVETVKTLMATGKEIINPTFQGKKGHPLLFSESLIPALLEYDGEDGLRGALYHTGRQRDTIEVDDVGILVSSKEDEYYPVALKNYHQSDFYPEIKIQLCKEKPFFGPGVRQLLYLIQATESVRLACKRMGISYSKGWKMIQQIEKELECSIVIRQQGGEKGGSAMLTSTGENLLETYSQFEDECKMLMEHAFEKYFTHK